MEVGATVEPGEIEDQLVRQALSQQTEIVILPLREVDGIGIYPESTLALAKRLRAQGVKANYLHPSDRRSFELKKSALLAAGITVLLGVASSAGWDAVKRIFNRGSHSKLDVTVLELESPEARGTSWRVQGDADAVLKAIEQLRGQRDQVHEIEEAHVAPLEEPRPNAFEPAGSDEDLRLGHIRTQIADRRSAAEHHLGNAKALLEQAPVDWIEAERNARQALVLFARSLDWAEDTDEESEAHTMMDQAGSWVRSTFGCTLTRHGNSYRQTCPVALAHNRIGFSVGGSATRLCSLCGADLSDCEHEPGTAYLVPGGPADLGWCRVCLKHECDHDPSHLYRVSVVARVQKMDVDEISLVYKPAQPEGRITEMSVTTSDLKAALGEQFAPGMDVSCDRCLQPCRGLVKHVED